MSSTTSSPWKIFFWHNFAQSFHVWGEIEADRDKLPEVTPGAEYAHKITMNISDILTINIDALAAIFMEI